MARRLTGLGLAIEGGALTAKSAAPMPPVYLAPDAHGIGIADMVVLVGDIYGRVLGELLPDVQGVAWKLNDYGLFRFALPRTSATATEEMLRAGNRILIQFGNGLPDWGGVLDLPQKWADGRIELTAYSGERLLADRITAANDYFTEQVAGDIFAALLRQAVPIPGLTIGDVWRGGERLTLEYHYRSLYDAFARGLSGQLAAGDWNVTSGLAGGRIVFQANFYRRRGVDHGRRLALVEGVNMTDPGLQAQGTIVNERAVAGSGTGWDATERLYAVARDESSIAQFGLRQRGEVRVDLAGEETLAQRAAALLAESKEPRSIVDPTALDMSPARWRQYDVGDSVWVETYEAGFGGFAGSKRVMAREFLPKSGVCALVVE